MGVPFLFYAAREEIEGKFPTAPIVHKPASQQDVVGRVEQLLR
jgi:hypothetical protein